MWFMALLDKKWLLLILAALENWPLEISGDQLTKPSQKRTPLKKLSANLWRNIDCVKNWIYQSLNRYLVPWIEENTMGTVQGEKYSLKWNDFTSNLSSAFNELRDDEDFFDITLLTEESEIRCHKLILGACSPHFRYFVIYNWSDNQLLTESFFLFQSYN